MLKISRESRSFQTHFGLFQKLLLVNFPGWILLVELPVRGEQLLLREVRLGGQELAQLPLGVLRSQRHRLVINWLLLLL